MSNVGVPKMKAKNQKPRFHISGGYISLSREGAPGRPEPPLCRHEPSRFARQTKPSLCRNLSMYNTPKCACVIQEGFLNLFFKFE